MDKLIKHILDKDKVGKPWGSYVDYYRNSRVVFKKIVVLPNEKLSYQFHLYRHEFWYVVSGHGELTLQGDKIKMGPGDYVFIEKEEEHMIECVSDEELIIYEMQIGRPSEDDIVRLEDKYGRTE